jgi:hypothetical protein
LIFNTASSLHLLAADQLHSSVLILAEKGNWFPIGAVNILNDALFGV